MENIENYIVNSKSSIKDAIKKLDILGEGVIIIVNDLNDVIGIVTNGDFRRAVLQSIPLTNTVDKIMNSDFTFLTEGYSKIEAERLLRKSPILHIPILKNRKLVDLITEEHFFNIREKSVLHQKNDMSIVIMAGGKGTRLKPFTDVLPKPLVPIQEKPIMDWIIEEFKKFGFMNFYGTLNYKGKMIEAYYNSIHRDYNIDFVWEDDFWGTAGSLKLLKDNVTDTFIVSNCDILVRADYLDVVEFHKKSGAMLTVVSSIQHHQIPYGVLEFNNGGSVKKIMEKPEYTHAINTGVYVLDKSCLNLIPDATFFHITHLMEAIIAKGHNVMTYPVNESDYIDIGQWEEYSSAVERFKF